VTLSGFSYLNSACAITVASLVASLTAIYEYLQHCWERSQLLGDVENYNSPNGTSNVPAVNEGVWKYYRPFAERPKILAQSERQLKFKSATVFTTLAQPRKSLTLGRDKFAAEQSKEFINKLETCVASGERPISNFSNSSDVVAHLEKTT